MNSVAKSFRARRAVLAEGVARRAKSSEPPNESCESGTRVLFVGDPHFRINNVEWIPLFVSRIIDEVDKHSPHFVVVAGDLLHNHETINVEPFNLATDFLNLLRTKVRTFVLVGNHDYKNNQQFLTTNHWMNAMKLWDPEMLIIVDTVVEFGINEHNFLFVPYVPPGRFSEALETLPTASVLTCVFAHQEFYGCKMGAIQSAEGDKWSLTSPLVVSGHVHNKQWPQKNIYYPGSSMQHAFGQSENNTITLLTFKSTNASFFNFEEIDLCMPVLKIKYYTIQKALNSSLKNTEFKKYKFVIEGTLEDFKVFKKTQKYQELIENKIKIVFKPSKLVGKNTEPTISQETNTFLELLHNKIAKQNDPILINMYTNYCAPIGCAIKS